MKLHKILGTRWLALFVVLASIGATRAAVDLLPDVMAPADASRRWIHGWRLDYSTQPGRTLLRVTTGTPNVGAGPLELQGSSSSPEVVQRIFRSDGSSWTRPAGTFTFHPTHGHLHFDRFMQFRIRAVGPNNSVGEIIAAGEKMSFAIIDLATYDRSLPGSPSSPYYGGGLRQGISVGYTDIYDQSISGQHIDITDIPEGPYWLEAEVDPENRILESNENNNFGRILIDLRPPAAPGNDLFANALSAEFGTQTFTGSTIGATAQPGEPTHAGFVAASVWFRWTARTTGTARITTQGSDYDTVLAVYSGASLTALTRLGQNDDANGGVWSDVSFSVVAGREYHIAVDGFAGDAGMYVLNINPNGNDRFVNATALAGANGSVGGSTLAATRESGEPVHSPGATIVRSIWYSWTAATDASVTFDTVGSLFNTVLAVYTGSAVNALTLVAADNDSGGNLLSRVTFNATAGVRYYIAVDGSNSERGFASLQWTSELPCAAPVIVQEPVSHPAQVGSQTTFSVVATGSSSLSYQWYVVSQPGAEAQPLNDTARVSGTTTATLRINSVQVSDGAYYFVRVSSCDPAQTAVSGNAQLVVTSDATGVNVHTAGGFVGETVCAEVELHAVGGENSVSGTLLFDPNLFANARLSASPAVGTHTLTTESGAGRVAFTLTLSGGLSFAQGHNHILQLCLDATGEVNASAIGFDGSLRPMQVRNAAGELMDSTFSAGQVTIRRPIRANPSLSGSNAFIIQITGSPGAQVRLRSSSSLGDWDVGSVITLDANGAARVDLTRNPGGTMFYIVVPE